MYSANGYHLSTLNSGAGYSDQDGIAILP